MAVADPPARVPQVLPRPADWSPGDPAPWHAGGAPGEPVSIAAVRAALVRAGRTFASPVSEVVHELEGIPVAESPSDNAVLVALFEEHGQARVLFERRSNAVRRHRGEVSFPGGRVEPGESSTDAALREAHEEIGLVPGAVELVGWLAPLRTYSGLSLIHPYVGILTERPTLVVQPAEVAYAFDVSLAELLAEGTFRAERWRRDADDPAGYVTIYVFEAGGETIWGATARILAELCSIVALSSSS